MVGGILKQRREELGRDLREIASYLKIRYDYLKALEDGETAKLPAEVYVKGYIQEYAKILNMDPEPLIAAYAERPPLLEGENICPEPKYVKKQLKIGYFLIPLLLVPLIIVASVQLLTPKKKVASPAPTVAARTEKDLKAADTSLVLQVVATDTTWLFVTIDKAESKEILLKPGDSVTWHAKKGFFLKIGNAGGIRLLFNGKEIRKIGEKGQVIKVNLPSADT